MSDTQGAFSYFQNVIQGTHDKHFTKKPVNLKDNCRKSWLTTDIKNAIKTKNKSYKKSPYDNYHYPTRMTSKLIHVEWGILLSRLTISSVWHYNSIRISYGWFINSSIWHNHFWYLQRTNGRLTNASVWHRYFSVISCGWLNNPPV